MKLLFIALAIILQLQLSTSIVSATEFSTTFKNLQPGERLSDEFVLNHFGVKIINAPMAWTIWRVKEKISTPNPKTKVLLVEVEDAVGGNEYLYSLDETGKLIDKLHLIHFAHMDAGCNDSVSYQRCSNDIFIVRDTCYDDASIGKINTNIYKISSGGRFLTTEDSYCPNIRKYSELSKNKLMEQALTNLDPKEIRIMRNEIFASHGHVFKDAYLRGYFENKRWYKPNKSNSKIQLNDIEKANIELLLKWENNPPK